MKASSILILLILITCSCNSKQNNSLTHKQNHTTTKQDTATFGEGCFWCIEPIYTQLNGVDTVIVGFSGGAIKNPTYQEVSTGNTGNAEVAQIIYNPSVLTYEELLKIFWATHDPTTLNRQNADVGTQYRSIIFYHNEQQKKAAILYKNKLEQSGSFDKPIITEIVPFKSFYAAEAYHQQYYKKHPNMPYSVLEIKPRLKKFENNFKDQLKKTTSK